eukprot:1346389-Rhodomonas_salina.1
MLTTLARIVNVTETPVLSGAGSIPWPTEPQQLRLVPTVHDVGVEMSTVYLVSTFCLLSATGQTYYFVGDAVAFLSRSARPS